jgi:hypothetical protein
MIIPEVEAQRTPEGVRPRRRGVTGCSVIAEAKAKVATIDLADLLAGAGTLRKKGAEWETNCLLPDHEDRTPSFRVNIEKNAWFCHGCIRGGDVVELARLAWGYAEGEAAMAASDLLRQFGHPIPPRPGNWHTKQRRQDPVRRVLEESKIGRVQRRLYRWMFAPVISRFEDPDERLEEARHAWEECGKIARLMVYRARWEDAA